MTSLFLRHLLLRILDHAFTHASPKTVEKAATVTVVAACTFLVLMLVAMVYLVFQWAAGGM